jgi:hypothetical protein
VTVREHLIAARALVALGWCQGADAKDADGRMVYAKDPAASTWCVMGALRAADPLWNSTFQCAVDAFRSAARLRRSSIAAWNDRPVTTQAYVLAVFDRAIAREAQ